VGRGPGEDQEAEGQVQISELFVEEKCSPAVLDFLRSMGVGTTVPREGGENEEAEDQTLLSALLSALLSELLLRLQSGG